MMAHEKTATFVMDWDIGDCLRYSSPFVYTSEFRKEKFLMMDRNENSISCQRNIYRFKYKRVRICDSGVKTTSLRFRKNGAEIHL